MNLTGRLITNLMVVYTVGTYCPRFEALQRVRAVVCTAQGNPTSQYTSQPPLLARLTWPRFVEGESTVLCPISPTKGTISQVQA